MSGITDETLEILIFHYSPWQKDVVSALLELKERREKERASNVERTSIPSAVEKED